jgi:hypothetical protein
MFRMQMSMNQDSFSVLTDNQKQYTQKARAVNPYAPEEEQMKQACATSVTCQQQQKKAFTSFFAILPFETIIKSRSQC